MENEEWRCVIKYYYLRGFNVKQIHQKLLKVPGQSPPSIQTVYSWFNEFKLGRTSTKDEKRCGRPKDVSTPELINLINDYVLCDRQIILKDIAEGVGVSVKTVFNVIHKDLGFKKICARWVPRMLTEENMKNRKNISATLLARFEQDPNNFLDRLVTQDETWVHYFTPEQKRHSMQWRHSG